MAKQAQKSEVRKSYAGILVVTVIALVASMFLLRELVFAPAVAGVPSATDPSLLPATDNAPPTTDDNKPSEVAKPTETQPTTDAPTPTEPATQPDLPKAESISPPPAEPKSRLTLGGPDISFLDATFIEVSVGSAEKGDGYTAVFTDRGGVMPIIRFIDGPRETGKSTFSRTSADPAIKPKRDDPEQTLLLLGPTESVAAWTWDASIGGFTPRANDAPEQTPFPDLVARDREDKLFQKLWRDEAEFPYGFSGALKVANGKRWQVEGPVTESDHKRITFTLPGGDADATLVKTFRVYPGFKIVCDLSATAGPNAAPQDFIFSVNGPSGIREDLFRAERAGVTTMFEAGQGLVYDHHEHVFGEPLLSQFNGYKKDLAEQGRPDPGNVLPVHGLYENELGHRAMLHGLSTGYFLAAIGLDGLLPQGEIPGAAIKIPYHPTQRDETGNRVLLQPIGSLVQTTFTLPAQRLAPGETVRRRVAMYAGPQNRDDVVRAFAIGNPRVQSGAPTDKSSWDAMVPYGWPAFISAPISWILNWLATVTGMAGLAIICLVIIVRLVISPLSIKAQATMQIHGDKLRKIKPKLDAIKEKYKDQKGREVQMLQFQETRAVMKLNNVSMVPLGGCLILLLQMPIFIALYNTVRTSFILRHEEFLWITDLARPDNLLGAAWQTSIPIIGSNGFATLNLLPILWSVLLIVQQRMQTKPTDEQQARMQKNMAIIMPLMGLFFYAMPAGFTLYFVVSAVYSFIESRLVKWWLVKTGKIEAGGGMSMAPM